MLESWNDGPTKSAIVDFVGRVTAEGGPDFVAPEARVAVFDNDGTLWCEKPMYIQLDFLLRRFKEQAEADPSLRDKQPYKAAYTGDLKWLGDAVTKHYQGDDTDLKPLAGSDTYVAHTRSPSTSTPAGSTRSSPTPKHPTLGRPYTACGYAPMVELLRYLEANGFTNYIVSGGGRDFMRPITGPLYGIPPERVVGSSVGLVYKDGDVYTTAEPEFLDDGPIKPVRLWNRIGRRPIFAAGNSNGDIEMLEFTGASSHAVAAAAGAARRRRARIRLRRQGRRSHWTRPPRQAGPWSA